MTIFLFFDKFFSGMLARLEGSSSLNSSSPAINKNVLGTDSKNVLAGDVYF